MQLVGMHDSPYVRRVAITAQYLDLPLEYRQISIFRNYETVRDINPMVKVPTLVCDDGQVLVESTLIIDYLESRAGGKRLMPGDEAGYIRALNIIGTSLVAMEKTVQLIYETQQRPPEVQHPPWQDRVREQLGNALELLEADVGNGGGWLFDDVVTQADISTAVAWRFLQLQFGNEFPASGFPGLAAFSARAEREPEFLAVPVD